MLDPDFTVYKEEENEKLVEREKQRSVVARVVEKQENARVSVEENLKKSTNNIYLKKMNIY